MITMLRLAHPRLSLSVRTFEQQHGMELELHHDFQQALEKYFAEIGVDVHAIGNLRLVPKEIHKEATKAQTQWWVKKMNELAKTGQVNPQGGRTLWVWVHHELEKLSPDVRKKIMGSYRDWSNDILKAALEPVSFSKTDLGNAARKLTNIAELSKEFNKRGRYWARKMAQLRRGVAIMGAVAAGVQLADLAIKAADPQQRQILIDATIEFVVRLEQFEDALARVDYRLVEVAHEERIAFSDAISCYLQQLNTFGIIDGTTAGALTRAVWLTLGAQ